jgi:hypothetical protein
VERQNLTIRVQIEEAMEAGITDRIWELAELLA